MKPIIPRSMYAVDGDAQAKIREELNRLEAAEKDYRTRQGTFSREFGKRLIGKYITAAEKLRIEIEIIHKSGNATASYDGVSIQSASFGSKDVNQRTMEAFKRVNEAKTDIAEVLMPYDLWPILESALVNDLGPLQVGEICDRQAGLMRGRDKRIEVGFNVMESILKAITDRA